MNELYRLVLGLLVIVTTGCQAGAAKSPSPPLASGVSTPVAARWLSEEGLPLLVDPQPDAVLQHRAEDFTQGLVYAQGALYQSTGRYGESKVQRLDAETGAVQESVPIPSEFFGEGLAVFEDQLYQLTWTSGVCLIYDRQSLRPVGRRFYPHQGWGLALSPQERLLAFTDGSSTVAFLDPDSFLRRRQITVRDSAGRPVESLNELEWVQGELWANVWMTDRLARIDPQSGQVLGWIAFPALVATHQRGPEDVLNGLAYDAEGDRLWVTGKLWTATYRFDRVTERFRLRAASSSPSPTPSGP